MTVKGAIFDVDGTLLDSMEIWDTIGSDYLISLGIKPREDLAKTLNSMSLQEAAIYYRTEYGVSLPVDEIADGVNKMVEDKYRYEVQCKDGVEDFLKKLSENGVKMCIATATDEYLVKAALERTGILKYFPQIFTCTNAGSGKTSPVIYEKALEFLGTDKRNTLVLEDALYAAETAKKAGFTVAGIYDRHEEKQEKLKDIADYYTDNMTDLCRILE